MGCGSPREKLEDEMMVFKLARMDIQMEKESSLARNKHKSLRLSKSLVMKGGGGKWKTQQLLSFNSDFTTKERNSVYFPQYYRRGD